jgi:type IX secretion system PorP/SprF family membrane protein
MIKRLVVFVIAFISVGCGFVSAQDPEFTQFYANKLYLNPAFAGSERCPRFHLNYRNQWPALGSTYVTYNIAYDQRFDFLEGGVGVFLMNDVQGDGAIQTFSGHLQYSYTFNVNRNFSLNLGGEAAVYQKKLDWDFIFPDQIHPLYGPIYATNETSVPTELTRTYLDASAGLLGYNRNFFFGFAVHHLTQPSESYRGSSDAVLPRKYTLHFGTTIPLKGRGIKKDDLSISPNLLFQQQRDFQQLNYGLYLNRKNIVAGIWFRNNLTFHYDSFILLLGYVQSKIKFAYSYDLTVSKLRNQTLGAHEVSFAITLNCKQKKKKFRSISCPSF